MLCERHFKAVTIRKPSTMISSSRVATRLRHFSVALLLASATITTMTMAQAGKLASRFPVASDSRAAKVAMLFHSNYCGVGSRAGTAPIDVLDAACMHHDACTPSGGIPSCDCNARLEAESTAIAQNPRQPPELQFLASVTAAGAGMMFCTPVSLNAAGRSTGSRARHIN
jgi:hypothetical protein